MVKIKKLKKLGLALVVAAIAATPFFFQKESDAATTNFYDYSQMPKSQSKEWSYARINYQSNTTITVKQIGRDYSGDPGTGAMPYETDYHILPGHALIMLIENSTARDSSGNPADVIIRVDVVRQSESSPIADRDLYLYRRKYICNTNATLPSNCGGSLGEGTKELGVGDPIMFDLQTVYDTADFTVQYIKKGSFNSSTMTGTPAGLTKMGYLVYDFDIPADDHHVQYTDPNSEIMNDGNEAIFSPTYENATTNFYYNKNNQSGMPTMYTNDRGRGIGISALPAGWSRGYNGIHWATSVYGAVEGMENSTYKFSYTGTEAGVYMFFSSPIPITTNNPTKRIQSGSSEVTSNTATTGDEFNYVINQDIPNNVKEGDEGYIYESLSSKYDSIGKDRNYKTFQFIDTLDNNLSIKGASYVKVYRGSTDVTSNFTVSVSGQTVTVSANGDYLSSANFYNTSFKVVIPVKVKATVNKKTIPNTAKTSFTHENQTVQTLNTNTVNTTIKHKLTVKHYDQQTGEELATPVTTTHDHGYEYTTSRLPDSQLPADEYYRLVETPANATGTLNKDTTVTYYYIRTRLLTVRHFDIQTGTELVDPVEERHDYGAEYEAKPLKGDEVEGETYRLYLYPENAKGTLKKDTIVYIFYIRQRTLTVKHVDAETEEELVDDTVSTHDRGYEYTTSSLTDEELKELPVAGYKLVRDSGNTAGTLNEDTTVTYYYTVHHKLTVKHIDKATGKQLIDPEVTEHPHGYEYKTEKRDFNGYQLIAIPENAEGILEDDVEVIYYYNFVKTPTTLDKNVMPLFVVFGGLISGGAAIFFFLSKRR